MTAVFRRTCGPASVHLSNQLGAGTPIHVVRDMAAHRSLSVTALYAHSTDEARRAASQRVQIAVLPARRDTNVTQAEIQNA